MSANTDAPAGVDWLMRSWRRRSSEPALRRQSTFARALRLTCPDVRADASRVSRWETGRMPVPTAALSAYERLLGLPAHLLAVTGRATHDGFEQPGLSRPSGPDDLEDWVDRTDRLVGLVDEGGHDGSTWLELSAMLAGTGHLVYLPPDLRARLARRITAELPRSVGLAWLRRDAALRALLTVPGFGRETVRAIGEHVTTPHAQASIELVANLRELGHREALSLLVRLLRHEQPSVRQGALWAIGHHRMLADAPEPLLRALTTTLPGLTDEGSGVDGPLVRRVLRHLPAGVAVSAHAAPGSGSHVLVPAPDGDVALERRRCARELMDALGSDDDTLHLLVRQALDRRDLDRRQRACVLLMSSPYRSELADFAIKQVTRRTGLADEWAFLLGFLVGPGQRDDVRAVAACDSVDPEARWHVVAHSPDRIGVDGDVLRHAAEPGAMYALGMTQDPAIERLGDPDLGGDLAGPARWWADRGGAVFDPDGFATGERAG